MPGPSDKSYGVEVAKLAGVPQNVVQRAREILTELERKREGVGERPSYASVRQSLLPGMASPPQVATPVETPHPVLEAVKALRPDTLSPMEALQRIYEWSYNFV